MSLKYLPTAFMAQDIVQEVFSRVWQQRKQLPELENFEAWLTTIAKNLLINQLRKLVPDKLQEEYIGGKSEYQSNNITDYLDYRQLEALLTTAVQQLPQRQRQVYELSRSSGLAHKEIAEQLGISYDMSREHMSKALKNIRSYLEKNYGALGLIVCLLSGI